MVGVTSVFMVRSYGLEKKKIELFQITYTCQMEFKVSTSFFFFFFFQKSMWRQQRSCLNSKVVYFPTNINYEQKGNLFSNKTSLSDKINTAALESCS